MAAGVIAKYAGGSDSGWLDMPPAQGTAMTGGLIRYRKIGDLVFVDAADVTGITTNGTKWTLPAGFRPAHTVYSPLLIAYPSYTSAGIVRIYGGGNVNLQFDPAITVGANANVNFTFVFSV